MAKKRYLEVGIKANFSAFEKKLNKLKKELQPLTNVGVGIAKGFAAMAAAGVAGMTALTISSMKTLDSIGKLGDKLDMDVKKLQAWSMAADLGGSSQEKLALGIQEMSKRLGEAKFGTGEAVRGLDALNIKYEEIANLKTADQFELIADRISETTDASTRLYAADKLMGRSSKDLMTVLMGGSEALNQYRQEMEATGQIVDEVGIKKVEEANDAIDRISGVFTGLGNQLAVKFAPIIESTANWFITSAKDGDWMGETLTNAFQWVTEGVSKAYAWLKRIEAGFYGFEYVANKAIGGVIGYLDWYYDRLAAGVIYIEKLGAAWKFMKGLAIEAIGGILSKFVPMINTVIDGLDVIGVGSGKHLSIDAKGMMLRGAGFQTSAKNEMSAYDETIKDIMDKPIGDYIKDTTFDQVANDAYKKMNRAMGAYEKYKDGSAGANWFETITRKANDRAAKNASGSSGKSGMSPMASLLSGLPAASVSPSSTKSGSFAEIDLANMSVAGMAMQAEQKVRDPQIKETNSILKDIKNKLAGGMAAVAV